MRIATVHLLLDVDSDGAASDFCSETFRDMPYVVDWAHVKPAHDLTEETTAQYIQHSHYEEGDFLQSVKSLVCQWRHTN
jgi:cation transport regulator ChaC